MVSVQTASASEVLCSAVNTPSLPWVLDALLQIAAPVRLWAFPLHAGEDSYFCGSSTLEQCCASLLYFFGPWGSGGIAGAVG